MSDDSDEAKKIERERLVAFLVRNTGFAAVELEREELARLRVLADEISEIIKAENEIAVGEVEVVVRADSDETS